MKSLLQSLASHLGIRISRWSESQAFDKNARKRPSSSGLSARPRLDSLERRLLLTGTLAIDLTADVPSAMHGDTVTYSYDVTFSPGGGPGDPTAAKGSSIVVTDDTCSQVNPIMNGGFNIGDTNTDDNLDAGEVWQYSCAFTVPPHSDSEATPIVNIATVTGDDFDDDPATPGTDTTSFDIVHDVGTLSIVKSADVPSVAHGGTVTFSFDVTYGSSDGSPATGVSVSDGMCDAAPVLVSGDSDGDGRLDVSETWTFQCSHAVSAEHSDGEADPIENTATSSGLNFDNVALPDATSDTVSVDVVRHLRIVKSADVLSVSHGGAITYTFLVTYEPDANGPARSIMIVASVSHGGTITYSFTVTFTPGDNGLPATNISIADARCDSAPVFTGGDTNSDGLLGPGETWTFECTHAVAASHSAGEASPIVNTATVSGEDTDGGAVTSGTSNSVSVEIVHSIGVLSISKNAARTTAPHGGTITYTFEVTYSPGADGSPAQNIVVSDAQCSSGPTFSGGDANSNGLLDGGETWTYTCTFTVPATHSGGEQNPIQNSASASGQDLDGDPVADAHSSTVSVDILHGTITGRKFLDLNGDGTQDANEPPLRGWTINLFRDSNGNGVFDPASDTLVGTVVTDASGNYSLTHLVPGTYFVREVLQTGFIQTTPARDVTVAGGEVFTVCAVARPASSWTRSRVPTPTSLIPRATT